MNKKELAKELAKKTFVNQKDAEDFIEKTFEAISEAVMSGDEVTIVGFGKFFPYTHSPRPVRNPKTQEDVVLKPYTVAKFKISPILKNKMKSGK